MEKLNMDEINAIRKSFEEAGNKYQPAQGIECQKEVIAGTDCYWFRRSGDAMQRFLVYVHGGGFFLGSIRSHGAWTSHLSAATKLPVLLIDYSLAPEHPFPTALHQVLDVMHDLNVKYPESTIGLVGDSAGGNIALAAAVNLKDSKFRQPAFNILISPWLDLQCKSDAFERNKAIDHDLTKEGLQICAKRYAGDKTLSDPMLSPLHGNLIGLNPFLVACGTNEVLEDDSLLLCQRLKTLGVPVEFAQFKGQGHSWSYYDVHSAASVELLNRISKFIEAQRPVAESHP